MALQASTIHVSGIALLRQGFHAEGEVLLVGATINGDLDCHGGAFHNSGRIALNADRITVRGPVFLFQDFQAEGEVLLVGATINGDLNCGGGIFRNPDGVALDASRAQIAGTVTLSWGFRAEGAVRLVGVNISANLDFRGMQSEGMVLFLAGARTSRLLDDLGSWHALQAFELDGFVYATITESPTDANTRLSQWLEWQPRQPFRPQPYYQLAKVLREHGQESDAKQVLIAKEHARRTNGTLGWLAWSWNMFLGATMAHGYQPQRLLLIALTLILLGGGLFALGDWSGLMIPTKAEAYTLYERTGRVPAFFPAFNSWLYSLDTFLPIINFGQKDHWRPRDTAPTASGPAQSLLASTEAPPPSSSHPIPSGEKAEDFWWASATYQKVLTMVKAWVASGGPLRLYRYFHIGIGWLLITLGIAGVTGLVRKE